MHVIAKPKFEEAAQKHPNQRQTILSVYRELKRNTFKTPDEMRRIFPSLDNFKYKDKWWVIDIGGRHLRLIAYINFSHCHLYVKHILTHPEYDKLTERYRKGEL